MHVIDDISGEPCEIYHDDGRPGTPQEIVRSMLGEILTDKARICITAVRLPTIEEWARAVKAVKGENSILLWNKVLSFRGRLARSSMRETEISACVSVLRTRVK